MFSRSLIDVASDSVSLSLGLHDVSPFESSSSLEKIVNFVITYFFSSRVSRYSNLWLRVVFHVFCVLQIHLKVFVFSPGIRTLAGEFATDLCDFITLLKSVNASGN